MHHLSGAAAKWGEANRYEGTSNIELPDATPGQMLLSACC